MMSAQVAFGYNSCQASRMRWSRCLRAAAVFGLATRRGGVTLAKKNPHNNVVRRRFSLWRPRLCAFGLTAAASFHFDDYALFSDPAITSPSGAREVWRLVQTRPFTYFTFS